MGVGLTKAQKKEDGMMMVRHQVGQNVLTSARERFGPGATSVDGYVDIIKSLMKNDEISVDDARTALKDTKEGPHLNEVLEAINRIEEEVLKK